MLLGFENIHAQALAEMLTDSISLTCSEDCFTLKADIYEAKKTTGYTLSTQTYAPQPYTGGTVVSLADDKFSSVINIGFDFCFFQNTYSSLVIGANGIITFTGTYAGQNCSFSTQQTIPYFNSTFPDNSILGPFVDVNFSQGGQINYYVTGTAPWREMVINYSGAHFFSTSCPSVTNTFQVILHETSNEIEVNIDNKAVCNTSTTDWLNYATLGIQNIGATIAVVAPGKNASIWTSNDESYIFKPNGTDAYSINWYRNGINIGSGTDTLDFCDANPNSSTYYFEYDLDCPTQTIIDTAVVHKPVIYPDSIVAVPPSCPQTSDGYIIVYPSVANFGYALNSTTFQPNNTFNNLGNGLYTIVMQDSNGCVWDSTIQFQAVSTLAISLDSIVSPDCGSSNGSIYTHAVGGVPPYSYLWTGGPSTSSYTGIPGGTYTITVTDSIGCILSMPVLLDDVVPFVIDSIRTEHAVCGDSSGSARIYIQGGADGFGFGWYPSVSTTDSAIGIYGGTYLVQIIDSNGCDTFVNITIADQYNVMTNMDTIPTSCGLPNGEAYVTPYGGLGPYTYQWTAGSTDSAQTGLAPGTYQVTVTAANGCQAIDYVYIDSSIAPQISSSYSNAYCDSNNGNAIVFVVDMQNPITYQWSTSATTSGISGLSPDTYWVTVTDSLGCILTDTIVIGDDGSPHLEVVSYTPPLCHGDSTASVTLSATGGTPPYKYSTDGSYFTTVAQLDNMPGGSYYLYVRDANSCTKDTLINFPQPDPILFTVDHEPIICYGDIVDMWISSSSGGLGYHRFGLDSTALRLDTNIYHNTAGTYTIYARDSAGCLVSMDHTIPGPSAPLDITFDMTRIPCYEDLGGIITAQVSGGWGDYDVLWSNGSTSYSQSDLAEGWYSFHVTDAEGCETTDSVELLEEECCEAFLPNAFTPDGDGLNDVLKVETRADIYDMKLDIYNRYGEILYHTINLDKGWDGTRNGIELGMGVYYYVLKYQCAFQEDYTIISGDVTLIR